VHKLYSSVQKKICANKTFKKWLVSSKIEQMPQVLAWEEPAYAKSLEKLIEL